MELKFMILVALAVRVGGERRMLGGQLIPSYQLVESMMSAYPELMPVWDLSLLMGPQLTALPSLVAPSWLPAPLGTAHSHHRPQPQPQEPFHLVPGRQPTGRPVRSSPNFNKGSWLEGAGGDVGKLNYKEIGTDWERPAANYLMTQAKATQFNQYTVKQTQKLYSYLIPPPPDGSTYDGI